MNAINLSELTWQRRGEWPIEVKVLSSLLVAGAVFFITYFLLVTSALQKAEEMHATELRLKKEFETKYNQAINLSAYKKQLSEMNARFGLLLRQLPTQNEMPALLEDISKTGIASGLTFELFAPDKEVVHPFYVELPVKITVLGTYHQLAVFLSRLAKISRIVTLHDFTIAVANGTSAPQKPIELLEMSITVKIYRYRALS
ncbi:MAG: type 4a pilus biogenesis protein PilO [Methylococcales bacterium]|nr:type 4a pilus biogenesis protein PilO [Methylococcales bacterium]